MIKKDNWRIIETILLRYPDQKREYEEYVEDILAGSGSDTSMGSSSSSQGSVVETKALKMTSAYMDRIKKEVEAVEAAYKDLKPEEQDVIRKRYWRKAASKPTPYMYMDVGYSERQAKRIVRKTVERIGRRLGEIK